MTFDREPDLDNANVGMPEHNAHFDGKLPDWGFPFFCARAPEEDCRKGRRGLRPGRC